MKKQEALNRIKNAETIEQKFLVAYDVLDHSPPISQDKMLMLYAYYKQAVYGDYIEVEPLNDVVNYVQTFKNNAWSQVKGLTELEAKKFYIEFTVKVIEQDYKD